jgi:3'(2'), 5'-bisphosphate nucleotidase
MSNTSRQRYAANSFAVHPVTLPLYRLCRQAGEVLRTMYVRNLSQALPVQLKEDASPVTRADQRSNAILLQGLDRLGAGTPVLSEESLLPPFEQRRHWQRYWLVDPLDGTREFIEGTGHFCINIALVEGHRPVLGAIYLPLTGQMYLGGVEQSPMVYTPQSQRLLVPSPAQRAGSI